MALSAPVKNPTPLLVLDTNNPRKRVIELRLAAVIAARKKQVRDGFDGHFASTAKRFGLQLAEWYGADKAKGIKHAEAFEVCEYGRQPGRDELKKLFPFFE